MLKDEGKLGDRFVAFHPVELKDHEQRKKQKLVDVKARYCHCLITTLAWSSWEESQNCGYKNWKRKLVFCRPAWLLYSFF